MSQTPGPWHFEEAKRILTEAGQQLTGKPLALSEAIAVAQVHATLALAAATAMAATPGANGMSRADYEGWDKVCGLPELQEGTDG